MGRARRSAPAAKEQLTAARADMPRARPRWGRPATIWKHARADLGQSQRRGVGRTAAGEAARSPTRRLADENRSISERLRAAAEERDALREKLSAWKARRRARQQPVPQAPSKRKRGCQRRGSGHLPHPLLLAASLRLDQKWAAACSALAFDKVCCSPELASRVTAGAGARGPAGYYASARPDVRLIYRRGEGNSLEISR